MALNEDNNKKLFKDLGFLHIGDAYDQAIQDIKNRKEGIIVPFKTPWTKLNSYINGGIEESQLYVVGARPGVGKSAFVNRMLFGIFDKNPTRKVIVLYYNFEMKSSMQIIREVSSRIQLPVSTLLSSQTSLSESYFSNVIELKNQLASYNILFRDVPCNIDYIWTSTLRIKDAFPEHHIIRVIDHTRLIVRKDEKDELERLNRLAISSMYAMKEIGCSDMFISQLNRDIEKPERAAGKYVPLLTDLFGADSIGQAANTVIILQRPEMYNLSFYLDDEPAKNLLAAHIVKNRNGDVLWLPFEHNLSVNKIEER
jgi:replicative DNA helicase